jgi:hypothetical protein
LRAGAVRPSIGVRRWLRPGVPARP